MEYLLLVNLVYLFQCLMNILRTYKKIDQGAFFQSLGDFLCIPTPNTGQLNPLFHTFVEFKLIVNRIVARQSTDWLAANAQFSPNVQTTISGWSASGTRDVVTKNDMDSHDRRLRVYV